MLQFGVRRVKASLDATICSINAGLMGLLNRHYKTDGGAQLYQGDVSIPSLLQIKPNILDYSGTSTDPIYTYVSTDRGFKKYKCKLCVQSKTYSLGKGPTNIRRHFEGLHSTTNIATDFVQGAKKQTPVSDR